MVYLFQKKFFFYPTQVLYLSAIRVYWPAGSVGAYISLKKFKTRINKYKFDLFLNVNLNWICRKPICWEQVFLHRRRYRPRKRADSLVKWMTVVPMGKRSLAIENLAFCSSWICQTLSLRCKRPRSTFSHV